LLDWGRAVALAAATCVALGVLSASTRAEAPGPFGGPYVGVNAGLAWGRSGFATNPGCPSSSVNATFCGASPDPSATNGAAVAASGTGSLSATGFAGGAQAGYNWQTGALVYGVETDFSALGLGDAASARGLFPFTFLGTQYTLAEKMRPEWLLTLRARLGYTVAPHLLVYATGGLAFSKFRFSSSYSDNAIDPAFPGGTGFGSKSAVVWGWAAGGGAEWLLGSNWTIRAECLYADLGSMAVPVPTSNTAAFSQTMHVDAGLTVQIARIGLNYRY
jgi:outer membrane immunogenic protein